MLHRRKKCSDILKVASVGGGEIVNVNACHFSRLPPEVISEMSLHFSHLWIIGQKNDVQIFKRSCIYLIITQDILKDIWRRVPMAGSRSYFILNYFAKSYFILKFLPSYLTNMVIKVFRSNHTSYLIFGPNHTSYLFFYPNHT